MERLNLTHVLFFETADFPFEVLILKFRIIITADVRVVEGVVEAWQ